MIFEKKGNILKAKTQAIVNPVNIMGVMGAGLALQIKKKYPVVFESYKQACFDKSIVEKGYHICWIGSNKGPEYIINIPTKNHYRELSSYGIIIENIITLKNIIDRIIAKNLRLWDYYQYSVSKAEQNL